MRAVAGDGDGVQERIFMFDIHISTFRQCSRLRQEL